MKPIILKIELATLPKLPSLFRPRGNCVFPELLSRTEYVSHICCR